jgi:hypothetical protein
MHPMNQMPKQNEPTVTFRTSETQAAYAAYLEQRKVDRAGNCVLCDNPDTDDFPPMEHWRIIKNNFPYDKVAERSWLLIPKRCVSAWELLTDDEQSEYHLFRNESGNLGINIIMWGTSINRSVQNHYHEHLLKLATR